MGFQHSELEESFRTSFVNGDEVRRSYITTDRSVAVEPRMEVSVRLNARDVMVSTLVGQLNV